MNRAAYALLELDVVLERCAAQAVSNLGRRGILDSPPLENVETMRRELDHVEEMARLLGHTAFPLQGLSDVGPTLKRVSPPGSLLERSEYLPLREALQVSTDVKEFFRRSPEECPRLAAIASDLADFGSLCQAMAKIFDSAGEIRDDASAELKRLRRQKEAENRRLHERVEAVLRQWTAQKLTQEDSPTYREGRLLIPVKAEFRSRVKGVVQDESASGATIFIEPLEAIEIGNGIRRLEGDEWREIHRLLLALCDQIRLQLPAITVSQRILGHFDSIYARARFARQLKAQNPVLTERPQMLLKGARHPLLALKQNEAAVPLNLELGGSEGSVLIITGPNAGGKTVALKTVGLLSLMAAHGLHVPADEGTVLPVLAALHCDIGDPQSLEQNLSTFTSHLWRLKEAMEDGRHPKLVLLDEIGAGTDPAEGSAIARAALLELQSQGALVVATTHQGALKVFAHETPGMFNGSMEFDQGTLQPTFRFRAGLPGSSYALEISARVGISAELLSVAKGFLGEETHRLENLIAELNESLRKTQGAQYEAEQTRLEMEGLRRLYQDRLKELSQAEKERLRQAASEAKAILEGANQRIEAEVRALREQQASRPAIKQAHDVIRQEKKKVEALLKATSAKDPRPAETSELLHVGDWVKLESLKGPVRIVALKKEGQEAMLEVGGLHIWMDTAELKPAAAPPSHQLAAVRVSLDQPPAASYELNLRGMRADEAAFVLQKYLDDCAISGWKTVRIIHGRGTGALRAVVKKVLDSHPGLKSHRFGLPNEGEFGVTIVELE